MGRTVGNWILRSSGRFHHSTRRIPRRSMEMEKLGILVVLLLIVGMGVRRRRRRSFTHREDL
jgi:hypothetical protein